MPNKVLFIFLFLGFNLSIHKNVYAQENAIYGKVVAITDGDTYKLLKPDSTVIRIRVANIDCPERKQPFSTKAKQFTADAIFGKQVKIIVLKKDRYGRLVAKTIYNDGKVLSEELLKQGLAWHYRQFSKDSLLQSIEDMARLNKIGLWIDDDAIAPWLWRRNKKK
ncbi:thermonuclease family protein [Aegicerativicinus sediminis]|uniref:thermonuclease family protein n=1 Tax=Aegicerativicinus sediminis TaxID=2893202 RepID=UPI001E470E4A|nr:thermonuclease family protein [Aegicerativicinus sediminis]